MGFAKETRLSLKPREPHLVIGDNKVPHKVGGDLKQKAFNLHVSTPSTFEVGIPGWPLLS
jgi:hypothetical protein